MAEYAEAIPLYDPAFKGVSELWILTHADLLQTARVKALMEH
jgi:hypothetical protein